MAVKQNVKEDVWIPTVCNMCFCNCSILAHRVDGVVVKIEGNPVSSVGEGRVCGKGAAGMMHLYDPNRKTKPMKRTNPEKGLDIDPGWVEISWEEAYTILAQKLGAAMKKNPKTIVQYMMITDLAGGNAAALFFQGALGGTYLAADVCGASTHTIISLHCGTGNAGPDYDYCKYVLQFGTQAGTATRHGFNMVVRRFADARSKGCKLVSVDPRMSAGAEKADIWIPIRPGTDAAFALAMAHVLVHELGIYDKEYLKQYTNGASLVDPETRRIIREDGTNKPYVWDLADNTAKVFDDPEISDLALEGTYSFNGKACKTAFEMYKKHLERYTPEYAEKITTVPRGRIRQIAKEFGEAANIGGTIVIDGQVLPYRPVCADTFSGISRHKHAFHTHWAILDLNTLVGSANVPGGFVGFAPVSLDKPDIGDFLKWYPGIWEEENLLEHCGLLNPANASVYNKVRNHLKYSYGDTAFIELQHLNEFDNHFNFLSHKYPDVYKQPKGEVLCVFAGNLVKNWGNHQEMADWIKSFDFSFIIDHYLNDTSYLCDLYIPVATFLERYELIPPCMAFNHHNVGGINTTWSYAIRQPVVEARDNAPYTAEVFLELAERLGVTDKYNNVLNATYKLKGKNALDPKKRHTVPEVCDHVCKAWFGDKHDLEWFKKNGVLSFPRKLEEVYIFPFMKTRIPIYYDFMLEAKEKVEAIVKKENIPWEFGDYQPLPEWKPGIDYEIPKPGYDLFPVYYTNQVNVDTWQLHNPWLNEINEGEPYGYNIEINSETARQKGLKSGDNVILQAANGFEVKGRLIVVEGIHPEVLGVGGGCWGTNSRYLPVAKGRGTPTNNLLDGFNPKRLCHMSSAYDQSVRVKVSKI